MQIAVDRKDDMVVARIPVADLDAANSGEFKHDIAPVLESADKVVIDLSAVRFVDSSGLGAMLSCLRQMAAKGGDLKLSGMSKQVRATFELVRMHRIFEIFDSSDAAIAAFKA